MSIGEKSLKHWIEHFYGFGSWKAPIWFVGYEESGGDLKEEVAEKLNYFFNAHPEATATLCDIRNLYHHVAFRSEGPRAQLFTNFYDYRFGNHAVLHGLWKNLISFVHGYQQAELPELLSYQRTSFVSAADPHEALLYLYPLPAHNHAWYYGWLDMPQFPFLKRRILYQEHVYQDRIKVILENIRTFKPEVVLMYGMDNINTLKESVQTFFPAAKFKLIKAIKHQIPQHHQTRIDGTLLLITTQIPALKHNRIESGFDWISFGKIVGLDIGQK
jgi:hypothetical protein